MLLLLLLSQSVTIGGEERPDRFQSPENTYGSAQAALSEKLVTQMTAFFNPQTLATQTTKESPQLIKSGTAIIMEVLENWEMFGPLDQQLLAGMMIRPNLQKSYDSPEGKFKIHYDTLSGDAVPLEDNNSNLIPDYVERIGVYCDSSYKIFSEVLNYLPAPTDAGSGGDDKYDVYLMSIGGYGATIPDAGADSVWNDYTSYFLIHRDFYTGIFPNDDPEGDTIGAQKVACAHEYFHGTQLAYDNNLANRWWMEAGATWMEEVVFPDVNDNYNFLPYFFPVPERSLLVDGDLHMYGIFPWAAYLQKRFDDSLIRSAWEAGRDWGQGPYYEALEAIDSALSLRGSDIKTAFIEFTIWNYFTGSREKAGKYYYDAGDYPEVIFDQTFTTLEHDSITPIVGPSGLGCNYIKFDVDPSVSGILEMELDGIGAVQWGLSSIIGDGIYDTALSAEGYLGNPVKLHLPFIEDFTEVVVIPTVISQYLTNNQYYLSTRVFPYGDSNNDLAINLGDASYIINYIFSDGPLPQPIWQSGDANCDGSVNMGDAGYLINYIFNDGPTPCANR